jgi:hypothetical protein
MLLKLLFLHLSRHSYPPMASQGPPTLNRFPTCLPATHSSPYIPHHLSTMIFRAQDPVTKQRGWLRFIPYPSPHVTPPAASHSPPQVVRAPSPLIINSDPQEHDVGRHLTRTESDATDICSPPSPIPPESTQVLKLDSMLASSVEFRSNYRSVNCPWEGCDELVHGTRHDWSVHLTDKHEIGSERTECQFDGCRDVVKGTGMARHISTSHTKVEDEACSDCGTKLSRRDAFLRHQVVHRQCSKSKLVPVSMVSFISNKDVVKSRRHSKMKAEQPRKTRNNLKGCQGKPRRTPRKSRSIVFPSTLCVF